MKIQNLRYKYPRRGRRSRCRPPQRMTVLVGFGYTAAGLGGVGLAFLGFKNFLPTSGLRFLSLLGLDHQSQGYCQ